MKENIGKICDFCGVPFPAEKTPYKPILRVDPKGKSLAFCCLGCLKAHEKTSPFPQYVFQMEIQSLETFQL